MRFLKTTFLVVSTMLLLFGCAGKYAPVSTDMAVADMSVSLLDDGIKGGGNVLVSAVSINTVLAALANGAEGETKKSFERFLGGDIDAINKYYASLIRAVPRETDVNPGDEIYTIANKVYVRKGYTVKGMFATLANDHYEMGSETLEFDKAAVTLINKWVKESTKGMIKEIVKSLSAEDAMVLINALYFKGHWKTPFKKDESFSDNFTNANGTIAKATFMKNSSRYDYHKGDGYQAVQLPYTSGRYSMILVLPDEGSKLRLTSKEIAEIDANKKAIKDIFVTMPKFELSDELYLKQKLSSMGLAGAFSRGADFSGLVNERNLYISDVIHKTKLVVDEEGSEAAAVTSVTIRMTSAEFAPIALEFNRPFLFYIWDSKTKTPMFTGAVQKL